MKTKTAVIVLALYVVGAFGLFKAMDHYVSKNYAMYKVGQYLEQWSEGNEFKQPELRSIAYIEKVGKENYLIIYAYNGGYFETVNSFSYLNKSYKPVTEAQAVLDAAEQWKLKQ